MFENIINFFKNIGKKEEKKQTQENSKDAAKERLHLVLMQDRANVSADFLELMKQEIIEVIKKYIEIDEKEIDVRLTNKENDDGTNGAPALYANIPILNIKNDARKINKNDDKKEDEIKSDKEDKENKNSKKESNKEKNDLANNDENKESIIIDTEEAEKQEKNHKQKVNNNENIDDENSEDNKEKNINNNEEKEVKVDKVIIEEVNS